MNTMVPTLLFVSVATGFAPQGAVQETGSPRAGSPVPVDASLQGLGTAGGVGLGLPADCVARIADQAETAHRCLKASSTPTCGVLFPYPGTGNVFTASTLDFIGGGKNNVVASGTGSVIAGGVCNDASGGSATIGGGIYNSASYLATVGGGRDNVASGWHSTVGGGGGYLLGNTASGLFSTVGGGAGNMASAYMSTVAGGRGNQASGGEATVAGGFANDASGRRAAVGGGVFNRATGTAATTPGGYRNEALADHSFAAGRRAKANEDGAFVWGDSVNAEKPSMGADTFNVYASGGATFFTNSAATTGVTLAAGGGSWSAVSDRDSKENVEPVDGRAVLEELVAMPLSTWNYEAQDDSIRHMGPMAQDFRAAFGLGVSDKLIDTIDSDGVALAAIQGLHTLVQEKDAEIDELRKRLERLEASL